MQEHPAASRLVSVLEACCADYPGFHLCYPQRRAVSRGLRALIETLEGMSAGRD